MEAFFQDVRYGFRMLRRNPGFGLTAILILAIGIGANTSVFSIVNSILLKPLPYPDHQRLVMLRDTGDRDTKTPRHTRNFRHGEITRKSLTPSARTLLAPPTLPVPESRSSSMF